jgi:hypothetical protein
MAINPKRTWTQPFESRKWNAIWRVGVALTSPIWVVLFLVEGIIILLIAEIIAVFWATGNFVAHGKFECPLWED